MNTITAEILCPSTARSYDYRLPLNMKAAKVIGLLKEDICTFEGIPDLFEQYEDMHIYCERGCIADEATIEEAGVKSGDRLMLI